MELLINFIIAFIGVDIVVFVIVEVFPFFTVFGIFGIDESGTNFPDTLLVGVFDIIDRGDDFPDTLLFVVVVGVFDLVEETVFPDSLLVAAGVFVIIECGDEDFPDSLLVVIGVFDINEFGIDFPNIDESDLLVILVDLIVLDIIEFNGEFSFPLQYCCNGNFRICCFDTIFLIGFCFRLKYIFNPIDNDKNITIDNIDIIIRIEFCDSLTSVFDIVVDNGCFTVVAAVVEIVNDNFP
ncbi:hypothetical protein DERP_014415 [Dermatophagoides pteronyssinus]|uniref:Uncharacterized protein n=1 Tax=Dermatophagoides pteronyssinus TaxID=6956 RepID=A0ABQ8J5Y1_DERPT|nr:hypothetical protein DERP_014415 [Dermatophagoides pteronyssinus]